MDRTAKQLVQLLDGGDLELRMATMRLVTELGISSSGVTRSLGRALREAPQPLKILALKGLGKLGARDVIHQVTPLLSEAGELREHAMNVIQNTGAPAIDSLVEHYPDSDFHTRCSICTILSNISTPAAIEFLFGALQNESFELQKHLSQCLSEALDRLPTRHQAPVFKLVQSFLTSARNKKDLQSQVVGLILLGHFRAERLVKESRRLLVSFGNKTQPTEVRRYALIALTASLRESDVPVTNDRLSFLESCLQEDDWENIAQHALACYQFVDTGKLSCPRLVQLLKNSPHFAVHGHVMERLKDEDKSKVASAIFPFLRDSRYRVRDIAEQTLRSMPSAMEQMLDELTESGDDGLCRRISVILKDYPPQAKRRHLVRSLSRFFALFDRNDRNYEYFFDFVRGIDPEPIRQKIYERVERLHRGKSRDKWLKISRYLRVLWDHHLITSDGRYTFALALIKLSNRDLSPHARQANLGLQVIRSLIYDDTPGLVKRLTSNKDLDAEDLFYIGFHFMDEGEELKPFAKAMLEYVGKKYPRSRVAEVAREKLTGSDQLDSAQEAVRKGASRRKTARAVRAASAARTLKKTERTAETLSKPGRSRTAKSVKKTVTTKKSVKSKATTKKKKTTGSRAPLKSTTSKRKKKRK